MIGARNISITKPSGPVTIMALLNGFCQYKVYKKSGRKPKQPGTGPVVTVFVRDEVAGDKGKVPKG